MKNLLSANFSRLWRSKELWLSVAVMFIISVVNIYNSVDFLHRIEIEGSTDTIDSFYFYSSLYNAAILGIFISFFLGREHSDGTLRNKLIVGHTRVNVFLANFIVCLAGSLIITAAWLIGGLPGLILIGPFEMGFSGFALHVLIALGITVAFTAIFVWAATASKSKAFALVFTIFLFAIMLLPMEFVCTRLQQSEFSLIMIGEEEVLYQNPRYVGGFTRIVFIWLRDLTPMGQAYAFQWIRARGPIEQPLRAIIASVINAVIINILGILSFRRKNLR